MIRGKLCRFASLYRLPSPSEDDFESFANNVELNIDAVTANKKRLRITQRAYQSYNTEISITQMGCSFL